MLDPNYGYREEPKAKVFRVYHERSRLRGLERIFSLVRQVRGNVVKKIPVI